MLISYKLTIVKMETESILANYEVFRFLVEDMQRQDGSAITYEFLEHIMEKFGLEPDEFAEVAENALFERKVKAVNNNPYGLLLSEEGNHRKARKEVNDSAW